MKTNLQYFAETDPKDPKDKPDDKKYTQADVNRMMSAKSDEITKTYEQKIADLRKEMTDQFTSQREELIEQGKKLAGETAEQEAQRKLQTQLDQLNSQKDQLAQQAQHYKEIEAVQATEQLLKDKGIPTSFAKNLSDLDETSRQQNVEMFANAWQENLNQAVQDKLKGQDNPQSGNGAVDTSISKDDFKN
ncbi:capsid assembly scaffolding protein Gp46 family protein [Lentilactobacillus kosonis]|uniref:DUF4355 domain-containing protein n=1 Tax=Lentilactobacillus kosonis TaxID=2810561 RepID=A0A401FPY5_9LACO|nr:DUF4355 domain-containing protein [Lentilactobacillus kosonis]GAY74271.1 hypothetical protein NBRC111893_2417 [Lentilactobacillus kosonis]